MRDQEDMLAKCFELLLEVGKVSPRYCALFCRGTPSSTVLELQADSFRDGLGASSIDLCNREVEVMLASASSLGRDRFALTEWQCAAYLRDQRGRGPSIAGRVFRMYFRGQRT